MMIYADDTAVLSVSKTQTLLSQWLQTNLVPILTWLAIQRYSFPGQTYSELELKLIGKYQWPLISYYCKLKENLQFQIFD